MGFSSDAKFFERAALTLLQGAKLDLKSSKKPSREKQIYEQLMLMHQAHLIAAEPQSYISIPEYNDIDPQYMGQTHIHPLSAALNIRADRLKAVAIIKDKPIADFEVLGQNWDERNAWRKGASYTTHRVAVLLSGDIAAMWQGMSLIRQRLAGEAGPPIIVQNTGKFWEPLFQMAKFGPKNEKRLKNNFERFGIFISSSAPETADILASFSDLPKINPRDINFERPNFPEITYPLYLFATTDNNKFNEVKIGLQESGATGRIRRAFDILGKSPIPTEEKYSYEGNAAEKMEALIERIRDLGIEEVEGLLSFHGYTDTSQVILMTNDGGLGACMENSAGERSIDLFSQKYFPDSHHRMNPIQMSPGVELAYLMRSDRGLETAFSQMHESAKDCADKSEGKFKIEDLAGYDRSLQMCVPLSRVLNAIQNNQPLDLVSLNVVSVFDGQKLKISPEPKGLVNAKIETQNYLISPDTHMVRAENPEWIKTGPNVVSFRTMQAYAGKFQAREISAPVQINKYNVVNMGLLGTPSLLFARVSSSSLTSIKLDLKRDFGIATRQGADVWRKFKVDPTEVIAESLTSVSNAAYRSGIRQLLDKSTVFYVGEQIAANNNSHLPKLLQGLSFLSAVVRNQIFNPINLVVDKNAVPELVGLIEHKQKMGLVGQTTDQLMTLVSSKKETTQAISSIVRGEQVKVTPIERKFISDGKVEDKSCMTVTTYFSAMNVNKTWVDQAQRLGYLMAVNGFNLKVGGGNDGLMKAVSDGFQKGKKEIMRSGHDFPNQLILIQCVDTESIESAYDGGGISRCHPTIEAREADLQTTDMEIAGAGGAGTDEEIFGSFYSREIGLIDARKVPFILFNQQMDTVQGRMGVHDKYPEMFDGKFFERVHAQIVLTPEEILARAVDHRVKMRAEQSVVTKIINFPLSEVDTKKQVFVPPYYTYNGAEGYLPPSVGNTDVRQFVFS